MVEYSHNRYWENVLLLVDFMSRSSNKFRDFKKPTHFGVKLII